MSKIRELNAAVGAGARNNKYRILIPTFGKIIDTLCHSIDSPGVSIGATDVFLKGRKYQIAGNRADAGTFTMTFYNEEDLWTRKEFISLITNIETEVQGSITRGIGSVPWYQGDIIIQQLDHNELVSSETILRYAFVSEVSNIEYTDEVGEITSTTVTFLYTGIEVR